MDARARRTRARARVSGLSKAIVGVMRCTTRIVCSGDFAGGYQRLAYWSQRANRRRTWNELSMTRNAYVYVYIYIYIYIYRLLFDVTGCHWTMQMRLHCDGTTVKIPRACARMTYRCHE